MNTNVNCDRFEREGILRLERGLSLDTHFDECPACEDARHKYESILASLPSAQPDAAPAPHWQSRVLRAAAESDSARAGFSLSGWNRSFTWMALAGAAALTAAAVFHGPEAPQFEVQAETHAATSESDPAIEDPAIEETNAPVTGEDEVVNTQPSPLPAPVAPKSAPKQPAQLMQPLAPQANEMAAPLPVPAKTRPVRHVAMLASEVVSTSPSEAAPNTRQARVTRPDKLYGLAIKYPAAAMKAKIQGETSVQCTIHSDGRNTNCRILKGLPYLDNAVLRAVESARSEPIRVDGKPVDNSDHIWHITITLREIVDDRTSARALPTLNWN